MTRLDSARIADLRRLMFAVEHDAEPAYLVEAMQYAMRSPESFAECEATYAMHFALMRCGARYVSPYDPRNEAALKRLAAADVRRKA